MPKLTVKTVKTVKDVVEGKIRACGPVTFGTLVSEVVVQVPGINNRYDARFETVYAINDLTREGKIELYDTGDAWDVK